jgi:hypothetical protein
MLREKTGRNSKTLKSFTQVFPEYPLSVEAEVTVETDPLRLWDTRRMDILSIIPSILHILAFISASES